MHEDNHPLPLPPELDNLPYNVEAEQALLGAILLEAETMELADEMLRGDEFYHAGHIKIFAAMQNIHETDTPIDLITLVERLRKNGSLGDVGGISYLTELSNAATTAGNFTYHVNIVKTKSTHRKAIIELRSQLNRAMRTDDPAELLAKVQQSASSLADELAEKQEIKKIKDVAQVCFEQIEQRYYDKQTRGGITGIATGYGDLDRMTAGLQKEDFVIVAARPSVGKTAFALNIAQNVAIRSKESVGIFSLEMSAAQLVNRMICSEGNVDANRMRTGYLEGEDWEKITMAVGSLGEANILIDDSPFLTIGEIRTKCRRMKREHGVGLILIDYLQLIAGSGRKETNRQQEVSEISRILKQIARDLDVTILALSQLSRGVEQRQDKRPMMSDLRESGSIEQDADIVAFLYRDDYYDKESEKKDIIEIIIAKQRNGPVGTVELAFLKRFNKFVNLDRTHHQAAASGGTRNPIPDMHRGGQKK